MADRQPFDLNQTPDYPFDKTAREFGIPEYLWTDPTVKEYVTTYNQLNQLKEDYGQTEGAKYPLEKIPYLTPEEQNQAVVFLKELFALDDMIDQYANEEELEKIKEPANHRNYFKNLCNLMQRSIAILIEQAQGRRIPLDEVASLLSLESHQA